MYIDSLLEFSSAQALTASAPSQKVIDLGTDRDIGPGRALWVVVAIAADAVATGTYQIDLETDDNAEFASPEKIASVTPNPATLKAGSRLVLGMPFENERYLRLNYTLGGTSPSATLNAFLTDQDPASWQAYPDGIA
ncbi:Bbp16 family capsid cement protein [Burkholderia singularis]|uniref:Uncharacterized protein n=1 Tax=Burkholderia singularis TaxID=1503053 RepID=A0A238H6T8_9BURK|nr:hypothetical protein [Burkholderia singularis]SMG01066.1 FIG00459510: hypothetical protein [Burkholderia singularis]